MGKYYKKITERNTGPENLLLFLARFWSYVEIPNDVRLCFEWTGDKDSKGYGSMKVGTKMVKAHRIIWSLTFRDRPLILGLVVDHMCRNKACVNPYHMRRITAADNVRAGLCTGGNWAVGVKHPLAKLDEAKVRAIRARHRAGESINSISGWAKVHRSAVERVLNGKTWTHVE